MKEFINVWIKDPDRAPRHAKIRNDLEVLQQIVGGYIEVLTLVDADRGCNVLLIVNEEGKINGLERNFRLYDDIIVGPAVFTGEDVDEVDDCPIETEEELLKFLEERRKS